MKAKIRLSTKLFRGQNGQNSFLFEADSALTKKTFSSFVNLHYKTKVQKINVLNRCGKEKKFKGHPFHRQDRKLFYVSLAKDANNTLLMEELNQFIANRYNMPEKQEVDNNSMERDPGSLLDIVSETVPENDVLLI
jgi:ribosomal protein L23